MSLNDLTSILRMHLRLIIAIPVALALLTAVYCWGFMPNVYTAEVSIYALAKTAVSDGSGNSVTYNDLSASQLLANDFAELARNDQILEDTARAMGLTDLDDFEISIKSSSTTRLIKVDVTAEDPEMAAGVANELTAQIGQTATRVMDLDAVNVINPAKVPAHPSGPERLKYTVLSLPVGFFLTVAVLILHDILDTRVHSGSEIEEMLGVSVIGHVPVSKGR